MKKLLVPAILLAPVLFIMVSAGRAYAAGGIDGLQAYTQALGTIVQLVQVGVEGVAELFKLAIQ